jgi:hypothetical protein
MRIPIFLSVVALSISSSCNCGPGTASTGGRGGNGGTNNSGTGGTAGNSGVGGSLGGAPGSGGAASAETCDGIDNDRNGIIDDVDVGNDGVCDCLRIATLGVRGTAGNGDVFATWLNGKSNNGAVSLGTQTITPALLAPFQVLIVQNVLTGIHGRTFSTSEVNALREWVEGGGGLMTLIGYSSPDEIENVNRLLQPYSVAYGSTPILAKSGNMTIPVTRWVTHPVSERVTRIGVDNGYPVLGDGGVLIASEPTPGRWDVLRGVEVGRGHVLVWGDEWITFDSEWSTQASYQVERFWLNSLKWLTAQNQCQVPITIN